MQREKKKEAQTIEIQNSQSRGFTLPSPSIESFANRRVHRQSINLSEHSRERGRRSNFPKFDAFDYRVTPICIYVCIYIYLCIYIHTFPQ